MDEIRPDLKNPSRGIVMKVLWLIGVLITDVILLTKFESKASSAPPGVRLKHSKPHFCQLKLGFGSKPL